MEVMYEIQYDFNVNRISAQSWSIWQEVISIDKK